MFVLVAMKNRSGGRARREPSDLRIAAAARGQQGVFSRARALAAGATPRMIQTRIDSGRWERLHRGVYRIGGTPRSWQGSLLAACLAAGQRAVVSHRSAAALWRFRDRETRRLEITVPRHASAQLGGVTIHRSSRLDGIDRTAIDGIPVTSASRTLIDLAAVVPRGVVEEALDDALRRRLTTLSGLRARLRHLGGSGRTGTAAIRALLEQRDPRSAIPESVFETRLLRALRAARLPKPVLQHRIYDGRRLVAVVDFAYPAERVAIEADGYRWHSGRARWARDLARRNTLTALGWRIVHVAWHDLSAARRRHVLARISSTLSADDPRLTRF